MSTPTHLLRWHCVADQTRDWPAGSFLEVGAGVGDFTRRLLEQGHRGVCCDPSEENRAQLTRNLAHFGDRVRVVDGLEQLAGQRFDYLFAFEVLEHIEEDRSALRDWTRQLNPRGRALVSVPAHMRKFGTEDRFVGHVRRYERSELGELLASSGLSDIEIANYGFPLTLITRRARSLLSNPEREVATQPDSLRSELSGRRRSRGVARLAPLFRESWVRPFAALQRVFYDGERGDGFVAAGRWTGD